MFSVADFRRKKNILSKRDFTLGDIFLHIFLHIAKLKHLIKNEGN